MTKAILLPPNLPNLSQTLVFLFLPFSLTSRDESSLEGVGRLWRGSSGVCMSGEGMRRATGQQRETKEDGC